jgi:hypothetical protein
MLLSYRLHSTPHFAVFMVATGHHRKPIPARVRSSEQDFSFQTQPNMYHACKPAETCVFYFTLSNQGGTPVSDITIKVECAVEGGSKGVLYDNGTSPLPRLPASGRHDVIVTTDIKEQGQVELVASAVFTGAQSSLCAVCRRALDRNTAQQSCLVVCSSLLAVITHYLHQLKRTVHAVSQVLTC